MPSPADKAAINNRKLTKEDFTTHEQVQACLRELKTHFSGAPSTPGDGLTGAASGSLYVSDVIDANGHQYVNLVQKGGGVLGIALVGYTYILEQMGIRFLRLAGTSAGAINTALMTVIGQKDGTKSETIVEALCDLNFFKLVDGPPAVRWFIRRFVSEPDFFKTLKKWLLRFVLILVLLLAGGFISLGLQHSFPWVSYLCRGIFVLTGLYLLALGIMGAYLGRLVNKLKESGYGMNPGDYLYDWIKERFLEHGVRTVSELNRKAAEEPPGFSLRPGIQHEAGMKGLKGDVTFITSELVTENKLQFPGMCFLFRKPDEIDSLQPAGFVRASMSIPMFFESYYIKDIPCSDEGIRKLWMDTFDEADPPEVCRFVDGGILSNFPINLFFNKDIKVPRLPTFGIDLDDSRPDDSTNHAASWSLGGYLGRMFNTIRYYYDKDFLLKNKVLQQGVGKVPLSEFNWLNFFLKNEEKIGMFLAGAEAAKTFLLNFDWEQYKGERAALPEQLTTSKTQHASEHT